jgi:lipid-A-disaccharide synthase
MSNNAPCFAIVAGEASGDILGAGLMQALSARYPGCRFIGVGGVEMQASGLDSLFPMDRLSVMGITEVLARLPELLRLRRQLVETVLAEKPDAYIGIDSPDFNLPIARRLHEQGIRTVHYVSPSVWAWRQGRIHGIKASIDLMLCLLPFEARFYEDHQVPVAFVGHPLADRVPLTLDVPAARQALEIPADVPVLAVLPGSRRGEVGKMMPVFVAAMHALLRRRPDLRFLIPAANSERLEQIQALLPAALAGQVQVAVGQSREMMAAADVVMLTSGTASLEAMLLNKPMVVGYRIGWFSALILSRLVKAPHVALPNLLAGERLVPELIQQDLTVDALVEQVEHWFDHPGAADSLRQRFADMHRQLRRGASERAARAVSQLLAGEPIVDD